MGIKSTGFLHIFDWNKKSHKKLFANGVVSPEISKQETKDDLHVRLTNQFIKEDDRKVLNDQNCASLVIDGEVKGTRAPGVVARLMGLDTFPKLGAAETCSPPLIHSQSLLKNIYQKKVPEFNLGDKFATSRKTPNNPIEKFSTDMLLTRPTKSLPISHQKLIAPAENPSFSSGRNADLIMETAVKILEPEHEGHSKGKASSLGSFRKKDIYLDPSLNEESCSAKTSMEWEETSSTSTQCNQRTVSKANVRRRGVISIPAKSGDMNANSKNRIQNNASRPGALRQNNLKQNGHSSKEKMISKSARSDKQIRRIPSEDAKHGKNLTQKKIQGNPNPPKKQSIKGRSQSAENTLILGGHKKNIDDGRRNGTDIVSFTFTSPIIKSSEGSSSDHNMMHDLITSEALSVLLEKKLNELSQELETSTDLESTSVSIPDLVSSSEKETVHEMDSYHFADDLPSVSGRLFNPSSTPEAKPSIDEAKKNSGQLHFSPQSILEATFSEVCSSSSESCDGSRLETKTTKTDLFEDSACSQLSRSSAAPPSEIEYITRLVNCSRMDSATDRSLDLSLFDLLEEDIAITDGKIERKALFDCVEDWLSLRRRRKLESGGLVQLQEKEELVGTICRDLNWWRGMGDWMVDELVAVDMSYGSGRWIEFPSEIFEKVADLEKSLVCNLLEELLSECQVS